MFFVLVVLSLCAVVQSYTPPLNLYSAQISQKLQGTTSNYNGLYPQVTAGNPGRWALISRDSWTSGFFPATMYEMQRRNDLCPSHSDGVNWLERGRKWSDGVLAMSDGNHQGHDQGFLAMPFVAELAVNKQNSTAITAVNKFAEILSARFSSIVGCTRSWESQYPTDDFLVIIDNMINIDLLFVSAELTGNSTLKNMAISHADTTRKHHFRSDHSTYHVVDYDPSNGTVKARFTAQGYSNSSTWSRGQTWAMLGFSNMYNRTKYPRYLQTARDASKLYLSKLPKNHVPPWDFNAPGSPATADTSSGAIAATALINLATIERSLKNPTTAKYYIKNAINILNGISKLAFKPTWDSILSNGTANMPAGSSQTGIVYGDYYFVKAGNDLIAGGFLPCSVLPNKSQTRKHRQQALGFEH